jgi:hypothetical protein
MLLLNYYLFMIKIFVALHFIINLLRGYSFCFVDFHFLFYVSHAFRNSITNVRTDARNEESYQWKCGDKDN